MAAPVASRRTRNADGLGYATPGAFTAMFRRTPGSTPSAYFADGEGAQLGK
ncbi:helix-turn-helix domain-containing protein [Streptomyces sp. NBC_00841]|uniref:hypothetical protein n=1 Tax=unclassified Streptomyces TaxID=2593676 RepID=UPI00224EF1D8|nr:MULTISPECIES: hypothetical protein [unclassified Streptomyces]MCX4530914.1 helix-turn-helix domain-containing protein [Streptomyces sp. NBC_01669]WSA03341.1 helix-turn-helix domain-containing protein [Streptomyces sp. NBC_00841]